MKRYTFGIFSFSTFIMGDNFNKNTKEWKKNLDSGSSGFPEIKSRKAFFFLEWCIFSLVVCWASHCIPWQNGYFYLVLFLTQCKCELAWDVLGVPGNKQGTQECSSINYTASILSSKLISINPRIFPFTRLDMNYFNQVKFY